LPVAAVEAEHITPVVVVLVELYMILLIQLYRELSTTLRLVQVDQEVAITQQDQMVLIQFGM